MRNFRHFAVMLAVVATLPATGRAQSSGTLTVLLGGPVAETTTRVHVALTTSDARAQLVRADSGSNEIKLHRVPAGHYRVETRAIGYAPDTVFVDMRDGRDARITVTLGRMTALDPVTIAGTAKGHLAAFEKRRAQGKGTFFTRDDIEKSRRRQVSEVLRTVRGLRVDCGSGSCRVLMVRSTSCEPRYYMNGFPTNAEALNTPVLDVAGIEVYRGPSETPPEYMGAQSMCGAVGIWTK